MDISSAFFKIFKKTPSVDQHLDGSNSIKNTSNSIKNIWNNHKGKFIILGIGFLVLLGLNLTNYSFISDKNNNKIIPNIIQAKNELKEALEKYRLAFCNSLGKVNKYGATKEPYTEPVCEFHMKKNFPIYPHWKELEKFFGIKRNLQEKCWSILPKYNITDLERCLQNHQNHSIFD